MQDIMTAEWHGFTDRLREKYKEMGVMEKIEGQLQEAIRD